MNVSLTSFLQKVEEISALSPAYRSGGSGKDGTCDCIGLIIGAIRRAGGAWNGTHGSNYAARNEMSSLTEIRSSRDLAVGELVYKHYAPGEKGYNLPARYKSGADLNDYYHAGVVLSTSPLRIRHMTSPCIKTDTTLGKWSHHGWCRRVEKPVDTPDGSEAGSAAGSPSALSLSADAYQKMISALSSMEKRIEEIYDVLGGRG